MSSIGRAVLEAAYEAFSARGGQLVDVSDDPRSFTALGGTSEQWTDLGDWLRLASRLGAEKVMFLRGEPVIVFQGFLPSDQPAEIARLYARAWCISEARSLFVAFPDELRIYMLEDLPARDGPPATPWRSLRDVGEVLDVIADFERHGPGFGRAMPEGREPTRADDRLIADLRHVRNRLVEAGLELAEAHALIGRSILIRYLEDRGVLTVGYFQEVARGHGSWEAALAAADGRPVFHPSGKERFYDRVLTEVSFTQALFDRLARDFNGDLFALDGLSSVKLAVGPLRLMRDFLRGDAQAGQEPLFFWAYDFEVIPLSLISSIYEQFYHDARTPNRTEPAEEGEPDDVADLGRAEREAEPAPVPALPSGVGTHYTPVSLVHDALRRVLTTERLKARPRVLDLACGSGIFLVEAFRRIVRHQSHAAGRRLSSSELRSILRTQVMGVEINAEAARVAAFSLYLALLDQQEPPEIRNGEKLPNLLHTRDRDDRHYGAIVVENAFSPTAEERGVVEARTSARKRYSGRVVDQRLLAAPALLDLGDGEFDVVVGNPPWDEAGEKTSHGRTWATALGHTVGEWSYSQLFILRALSQLRPGGAVGMLVGAKVLWNQRRTSVAFRASLLADVTVSQVVNMAHVRTVFFSKAVAPFAFVELVKSPPGRDARVSIWNARRTTAVETSKSVTLLPLERRLVRQAALAQEDHLWKTYWWGSRSDAALAARLKMETTLGDVVRSSPIPPAYGWQNGSDTPRAETASMRQLLSRRVGPFGPLRNEWFAEAPTATGRDPEPRIYDGQRIVVTTGVKSGLGPCARLETTPFSFRHTMFCVPLPLTDPREAKVILGTMWSSLGRYYLFMTSGAWAGWFDKVTKTDILALPLRLCAAWGMPPEEHRDAADRMVAAVDTLRNLSPGAGDLAGEAVELAPSQVETQLRTLDEAAFDMFELSEAERDLVRDFWANGFDLLEKGADSPALRAPALPLARQGTAADLPDGDRPGHLHAYIATFLDAWNPRLPRGAEFVWQWARSPGGALLAVAFTAIERGSGMPEPDDATWDELVRRCGTMLGRPVSPAFSVDWATRGVAETGFVFVRRSARRLWTATAAREDAEAALVRLVRTGERRT